MSEIINDDVNIDYYNALNTVRILRDRNDGEEKVIGSIGFMDEYYDVVDIGFTNFFYVPDLDTFCTMAWYSDGEFEHVNIANIERYRDRQYSTVSSPVMFFSDKTYTRGFLINRENKTIRITPKEDFQKFKILSSDLLAECAYDDETVDFWERVLVPAVGGDEGAECLYCHYNGDERVPVEERTDDDYISRWWKAVYFNGVVVYFYLDNDSCPVFHCYDLVEHGIVNKNEFGDSYAIRKDNALAIAENAMDVLDSSCFIDMADEDNRKTAMLYDDIITTKNEDIIFMHMAEKIGVHHNTLYRLKNSKKKKDQKKFELYVSSYKYGLMQDILEYAL